MFTSCVGGLIGTPFTFQVIPLSEEKTAVLLTFKKGISQVPKANVEEGSSAQIANMMLFSAKLDKQRSSVSLFTSVRRIPVRLFLEKQYICFKLRS